MSRLAKSSQIAADLLEKSNKLLEDMIIKQNKILTNIDTIFHEFNQHMKIIRNLLTEFQRIQTGESTWISSILVYFVAGIMIYLLTSIRSTNDARFLLYVVLFINFCMERVISRATERPIELIYSTIWICRYIFLTLGVVVLISYSCRYKDYSRTNHKILLDIKDQIAKLPHQQ